MDLHCLLAKKRIMNIVIIGQGAIGLLLYHLINRHKGTINKTHYSVSLRPSYQTKQKQANYQFTNIEGDISDQELTYADDEAITNADILIFAVKSYQVKQAVENLRSLFCAKATIALCHNGMGTLEDIAPLLLPTQVVITMLTTHGCLKNSLLNIVHTGLGQVDLGLAEHVPSNINKTKPPVSDHITTTLTSLLAPAAFHQNITEKQWQKLAINCVINPLTALNNVNNGDITQKKYHSKIRDILQEVVLVAKTQKVVLEIDALINIVINVAKATANNSSSMRCDVNEHKKTEIAYINGFVHHLGQVFNIATPANSLLYKQINKLQYS